eukprot:5233210-Pyramimonas_sp.AAC.1
MRATVPMAPLIIVFAMWLSAVVHAASSQSMGGALQCRARQADISGSLSPATVVNILGVSEGVIDVVAVASSLLCCSVWVGAVFVDPAMLGVAHDLGAGVR